MEPFKSILVDVDATARAHPAFERAVGIARSSGARLTVTDVVSVPSYARRYMPADLEDEIVTGRRQQLTRLTQTVSGIDVEPKLLTGRPGTVLVEEVIRSKHDLLMRSHARDLVPDARRPFGAVDVELVRKCPCPVLLVRHGGGSPRPQIVAAVNAGTDEPGEQALNRKIVETALLVARLEDGTPTLLQAWAPFAEAMIRSHASDDAFTAYVEDVRRRTSDDLGDLARSFGERTAGIRIVSRRGEPEEVIPAFVVEEGIDLVVMGTVARGGIAGLLIGNTAERLLRRLPCSVLTVKPDGFVSPVRVESS